MKIMKTYMGVTTGSYMGRDDGYPELKHQFFDLLDGQDRARFASSFNQEKEERYYFLEEMALDDVARKVNSAMEMVRLEAKLKEQAEKEAEKEDLLARLKQLEEEGY